MCVRVIRRQLENVQSHSRWHSVASFFRISAHSSSRIWWKCISSVGTIVSNDQQRKNDFRTIVFEVGNRFRDVLFNGRQCEGRTKQNVRHSIAKVTITYRMYNDNRSLGGSVSVGKEVRLINILLSWFFSCSEQRVERKNIFHMVILCKLFTRASDSVSVVPNLAGRYGYSYLDIHTIRITLHQYKCEIK